MIYRSDSVMANYEDGPYCYFTGYRSGLQIHHIMNGPLRSWSDKNGLWIYVRADVHNKLHSTPEGRKVMDYLKSLAQLEYERAHTHEEWMEHVGKNYL